MIDRISLSGFDFIKAGSFAFSQTPYQFKGWTSELKIVFYDDRFEFADETVYLLKSNDNLLYVGEFTYNLSDRWLKRGHVYHHMYDNIEQHMKFGNTIDIWLAVSPYLHTNNNQEINISKSLEQELVRTFQPPWNKRNKHANAESWRAKNCIRLDSIVE